MSDHIYTAKVESTDINTQKISINNVEIGTAILPKLVHRTTLHPVMGDDGVMYENQYYTLHNDAGDKVYISEFIQDSTSETTKVTPPVPPPDGVSPIDPDDNAGWRYIGPIIPSNPGGGNGTIGRTTKRTRSTRNKKENKKSKQVQEERTIINRAYYKTNLKKLPARDARDWSFLRVTDAEEAFMLTNLTQVKNPWPELVNGYRMYNSCTDLKKVHVHARFPKLEDGAGMFAGCTSLIRFAQDDGEDNIFQLPELRDGKQMFKECESLVQAYLYVPELVDATQMFMNSGVQVVDLTYSGNISNCIDATSMYEGCHDLALIKTEGTLFRNSLKTAKYMFWDCTSLEALPADITMSNLQEATGMCYNCSKLNNVSIACPSLTDATSMYQGCTSLNNIAIKNKYDILQNGKQMFANCTSLNNIDVYFPELTSGVNMFRNCSGLTNLGEVNISKLTDGRAMFAGCKLNKDSVTKIINSLKQGAGIADAYYGVVIGTDAQFKSDAAFRQQLGLPSEVPSTNEETSEIQCNDTSKKFTIAINWIS